MQSMKVPFATPRRISMNGRLRLAIGGLAALALLTFASAALAHTVVRIVGSMHDDQITGTPGPDYILARAGV
jgi:hypothetical protein